MTVSVHNPRGKQYYGLSGDTKPEAKAGSLFFETDTGNMFTHNGTTWVGTITPSSGAWLYTIVDVADDTTTIYDGPALLKSIRVETVLSDHVLPIKDDTTIIYSLAASSAVGVFLDFDGILFATKLIVDPNNAATGKVVVAYRPAGATA